MKGSPKKFTCASELDPPHGDEGAVDAPSTTQTNSTWDVVDLVGLVVEVCIQETGDPGTDWVIELSIPKTSPSHDKQFEWFKSKSELFRPGVSIERTPRFCRKGGA
eukprot:9599720-Prorocentrum_lima.AAC.1